MEAQKIYFDMDGVLADFNRGVRELCGMEAPDPMNAAPEQDDLMWERIREAGHFYDRLELMPGAKEMFGTVYGKYGDRCEILTGIPKPDKGVETAAEDKQAWMKRMLSDTVKVNICYRAQKIGKCEGESCILIDDYRKNIDEWTKAGGTGILFVSAEKTMQELRRLGVL